jgi:CheY-like chemotaxis protein
MGSKILIIDDDQTMLELIQTLLDLEGFQVSTLEGNDSMAEIIQEIKAIQPSLILCDVFLRDLNGLELLKMIRQEPDLDHVRILMSSGMDFSHQCFQEKADGFIVKPYMPDDLIHKIQYILSGIQN